MDALTRRIESNLPQPVRRAVALLRGAGYQGYLVGGGLRDLLRGFTPHDYDIASSAPPRLIRRIFQGCTVVETGLQYGTVTVVIDGMPLEITALRQDGAYRDGRRPQSVRPAASIEQDLRRRDFTINAMAYCPGRGLLDPCGGLRDLRCRCIRAVGDPVLRFQEDSLRILRALRFASVLGFSLDARTAQAVHDTRHTLRRVSQERITQEFTRLVCGVQAPQVLRQFADVAAVVVPELAPMFGFDQCTPYHIYDVWEHTLHVLENAPTDKITRLAALFHDIGKPDCFFIGRSGTGHFKGHAILGGAMTARIMRRMRYSNEVREQVCELVRWHDENIPPQDAVVRRWLGMLGEKQMGRLLDLQEADSLSKSQRSDTAFAQLLRGRMERILQNGDCCTLAQLAVNGRDLQKLGIAGPAVGATLRWLLAQVLQNPDSNERGCLLELAREHTELQKYKT